MSNILLKPFKLPPFSKIKPEDIVPTIKHALTICRTEVEYVLKQCTPFNWNNLCQPISETNEFLNRIFSPISHLHSVQNSLEMRIAYKKCLYLISEYNTWLGQHKELYQAYITFKASKFFIRLTKPQKKSIEILLRDFRLSGINLSKNKQNRYGEIISRLSKLNMEFSNNVLDATNGWSKLIINQKELLGLPTRYKDEAKKIADSQEKKGWLLTLHTHSYMTIMTYADNREIRYDIYRAFNTRASNEGPTAGQWDNSNIIIEILQLRHELAHLLRFKSYANKSLVTKMAKNTQQVLSFLKYLGKKSRHQGIQELSELLKFTKKYYNITKLEPWDIIYYSEKQKKYLYSINDEEIRSYFPEKSVLNGLFKLIKRVYGIFTKERYDVDVWNNNVRFFELYDETKELRGSFYLDLYTRENKCSGAWMDNCVGRVRRADGSLQKPVAYLTCNFNKPIGEKPALLTHNEVIILFHEFGHVLHHTMTTIEIANISGINGIPWDVVEFPSQFMENWCWEPEVLKIISSHYQTNKPLPHKIINKILSAKYYQIALSILRQVEFGMLDFLLHAAFNPTNSSCVFDIIKEVKEVFTLIPSPKWERVTHTFSHIFSGDYAACYYGYLWSEQLSADAFLRFKKEGIFNINTGRIFLDTILSKGGSDDPRNLLKKFLGRIPTIDALLCQYRINN
ncbi:oligopeptidase A [Candidatus Profftia sp. (ex Adelges kitamiensis)]|uniref:oligopeptidase A n=1 Tax=Candidatus Profftia sp. (ex Adelges kitamiensis) TaxID=2864218 RepID=UPI001CE3B427|nr:oligopeptidase A [Candidatus Profftia sp. (ex Adelges kitamiensis)]